MNGEREARFWSDRKKAFREFDHDEMTYATQALMGIYDALEDIRAILKDIDEDVAEPKMPSAQPEITLESAIDYLHSIGWMQEHDRALTESAQPERKTGEWIPCKTPPNDGRSVFIAYGSGGLGTVCIGYYDPDDKCWREHKNWFASLLSGVKYWCEIPELPDGWKEEGDGRPD